MSWIEDSTKVVLIVRPAPSGGGPQAAGLKPPDTSGGLQNTIMSWPSLELPGLTGPVASQANALNAYALQTG